MDDLDICSDPGEILLFACVRNEALRLPYFLEYYRNLGVSRFFLVDNGSTDGTEGLLRSRHDLHWYRTRDSYAESLCGVYWLNALLNTHGTGHWVVVVDADELLVYPGCEESDLHQLTHQLDQNGFDALQTFLLDMYAPGPIYDAQYLPGRPFLETCSYFDRDSYKFESCGPQTKIPSRGGARQRVFWPPGQAHRANPPYLPKIPLVRWRSNLAYEASTHRIKGVSTGRTTGALLHFKMFSDFAERVVLEEARGEHWDAAGQYSAYASSLSENPNLDPMYDGSVKYSGSRQLVELGLAIEGDEGAAPGSQDEN